MKLEGEAVVEFLLVRRSLGSSAMSLERSRSLELIIYDLEKRE